MEFNEKISNLIDMFFKELKSYNNTTFKHTLNSNLDNLDGLSKDSAVVLKSFSSAITRYFIFCEKHPEISDTDKRIIYYSLKLDLIANYFSNYPDLNPDNLKPFQREIINWNNMHKHIDENMEVIV